MKIQALTQKDKAQYDAFLSRHGGSIAQSWDWGQFQETVPSRGKFWAFAAMEGDRWLGTISVVRQHMPMGMCWLSVARGPVLAESAHDGKVLDALFATLVALAKREKAMFLRVEPPLDFDQNLRDWGMRKAHAHYQPEWSLRVALNVEEEEILKQMKPKGRYNIKVARKKGVTVRMTHDVKDVGAFYEVLKGTGGRDGFAIHDEGFYQNFVEQAHRGGWGELFVAEVDGKVIGGLLATFFGDTATYYYGASDHEYRSAMAPYLTQWAAMQEGKKRGCKWYDFLGVAPPKDQGGDRHAYAGITQFKEKFGGERIHYPEAREFVYKGFWYGVMLMRKKF
jgi:lipid II:glycine glycyltransferase (peptidoglycan interpeptide bridge formation enzyme)